MCESGAGGTTSHVIVAWVGAGWGKPVQITCRLQSNQLQAIHYYGMIWYILVLFHKWQGMITKEKHEILRRTANRWSSVFSGSFGLAGQWTSQPAIRIARVVYSGVWTKGPSEIGEITYNNIFSQRYVFDYIIISGLL